MKKILTIVPRWLPALVIMAVIFAFSSQPGDNLPNFIGWDYFVKKSSHALGYGLLAIAYFHYLEYDPKRYRLAWLMTLAYACTDEFHQSLVAGRHASLFDAFVFDGLGAFVGLLLIFLYFWKWGREPQ